MNKLVERMTLGILLVYKMDTWRLKEVFIKYGDMIIKMIACNCHVVTLIKV